MFNTPTRVICLSAIVALALVVTGVPALAQQSGTCGPLDNGRIADVFYEGSVIFWAPVVQYEYERMVLTISGPCETIVKSFKPGEQIFFDLGEIRRVVDGNYAWQLRATPVIDPAVQEALQASRGSGEEDAVWWSFWQKGSIPAGPSVDGASFTVDRGLVIDPGSGQESQKRTTLESKSSGAPLATAAAAAGYDGGVSGSSQGGGNLLSAKDFVIIDDLIVDGSACIGFDCVNGESFGFDTIRLKENNLRIKFDDTSTAASFPRNDWQITINDSANGGASKFSIDDISGSRTPFTIEANARSNSLYVDDGGRLGLRTSTPSTEIHTVDGDTPTLRLQQDGSSGFAPQTWDVAGNETNFFIRDVTNGSQLPFRIRPDAPTSSIDIAASGNVGIGTASPDDALHVRRTDGSAGLHVEEASTTAAQRELFLLENKGGVRFAFLDTSTGQRIAMRNVNSQFQVDVNNDLSPELRVAANGDLTITGSIFTGGGTCGGGCDRVFQPGYPIESIEEHAAEMWDNSYLPAVGPTQENAPINLTEKTGGILNELEKAHIYIEQLNRQLKDRDEQIGDLTARLERVERALSGGSSGSQN